jgi:PhnB protein
MRQTVTPYLLYEDAPAAVEFLTEAFGFREIDRMTGEGGGMHVEMEVASDGAKIYLGAPTGDFRGPATAGQTSMTYVLVDDVDRHYQKAKAAGATITEELIDLPYGDRRYGCDDAQGHAWTFATQMRPEAAVES